MRYARIYPFVLLDIGLLLRKCCCKYSCTCFLADVQNIYTLRQNFGVLGIYPVNFSNGKKKKKNSSLTVVHYINKEFKRNRFEKMEKQNNKFCFMYFELSGLLEMLSSHLKCLLQFVVPLIFVFPGLTHSGDSSLPSP